MPAVRAASTAASRSATSSRVSPKLGSQSCGTTPWRPAVSASRAANLPTKEPAGSSKFFQ